ncbi:MAG: leucyl aminopeptidase [Alphaproteobacteria bacterium]|nr:leucyl aminopeptidase [Alphaproteobacteria bacterium]
METMFVTASLPRAGALVIFAGEGGKLEALASQVDARTQGHVKRAIKSSSFAGKKDQLIDIVSPSGPYSRIFVFGTGREGELRPLDLQMLGGAIAGTLQASKLTEAHVLVELAGTEAARIASGAGLRVYAFNRYKSKPPESVMLKSLTLHCADPGAAKRVFSKHAAVAEGVHLARNLVNEPPNRLFPAEFANRARELSRHGVKVEILTPGQMRKLGMGALLGVAQGSAHEARLAVMRWDGGRKGVKPVAFIGKGVTFDTGGISIKPAAGMEDMKGDMAGAACVTGLMLALAKRKAKVNAVGAIGLVENMPDGNAQRPGDIVTSMSGQTISVLNTDAEGRLVLADVLWYVQNRFKPQFMINLATLTGAIMVALGKEHAGLFSNNDELAKRLSEAGTATGEKVWRMPLAPEYDKLIDSDVADMKNIGGRYGGAITAAQFLQRFVNGVPWAHLDVAGTAMDSARTSINQSWGSGWGVRLLDQLVADNYEA